MPCLVYSASMTGEPEPVAFDIYLEAAAKIVETVAFEVAGRASSATVEDLLGVASRIESLAETLRDAD